MNDQMGIDASDQAGRMNPRIKARWCAALRSGKYEPLTGMPFLRRRIHTGPSEGNDLWNALGVLCDVLDIRHEWKRHGNLIVCEYDGADSYLTPRTAAMAGIGPKRGAFVARIYLDRTIYAQGYDIKNLSSAGTPFRKLADIIEEQL